MAATLAMRMRTRSPSCATIGSVPGKAFALKVKILKSVISFGFGREVPTSIRHSDEHKRKIPVRPLFLRPPRVDDEEPHRAKRHLRHFVVVRVIHVRSVLAKRELVAERFTRLDNVLGEASDSVHAIW